MNKMGQGHNSSKQYISELHIPKPTNNKTEFETIQQSTQQDNSRISKAISFFLTKRTSIARKLDLFVFVTATAGLVFLLSVCTTGPIGIIISVPLFMISGITRAISAIFKSDRVKTFLEGTQLLTDSFSNNQS